MKKRNFVLLVIALMFGSVFAQGPGGNHNGKKKEQMKAMKIAFLTEKLTLSPEEAQKFWPVYNQYEDELKAIRKEIRMDKMNAKESQTELTDQQAEEMLNKMLNGKQAELDIMRKYVTRFRQVLPTQKVSKLFIAENMFKRHLMSEIKERRPDHGEHSAPRGPRPPHSDR